MLVEQSVSGVRMEQHKCIIALFCLVVLLCLPSFANEVDEDVPILQLRENGADAGKSAIHETRSLRVKGNDKEALKV